MNSITIVSTGTYMLKFENEPWRGILENYSFKILSEGMILNYERPFSIQQVEKMPLGHELVVVGKIIKSEIYE